MCRTQRVRLTGPRAAADQLGGDVRPLRGGQAARIDQEGPVGVFAVGRCHRGEVAVPVQAEDRGQVGVGTGVVQDRRPAHGGGRVANRRHGVPGVVLAVAEGPFAVFPGLAPVDRGQADEERALGQRSESRSAARAPPGAAAFEQVVAADVVVDARLHSGCAGGGHTPRWDGDCCWRGCAAAAQRAPVLLPGGQPQGHSKSTATVSSSSGRPRPHRGRRGRRRGWPARRAAAARRRRAREGAERVGLGRPVQEPGPARVAVQVMLGPFVVRQGQPGPVSSWVGHGLCPLGFARLAPSTST